MIRLLGGALTAAWAAARVPLWLHGRRWTELLQEPPPRPRRAAPPRGTLWTAVTTVRILAAVPGSPWKYTCLYRSVAECLVLRRYGYPAVVRIGVRGERGPNPGIVAHAWVVRDPAAEPEPPDALQPFVIRA